MESRRRLPRAPVTATRPRRVEAAMGSVIRHLAVEQGACRSVPFPVVGEGQNEGDYSGGGQSPRHQCPAEDSTADARGLTPPGTPPTPSPSPSWVRHRMRGITAAGVRPLATNAPQKSLPRPRGVWPPLGLPPPLTHPH